MTMDKYPVKWTTTVIYYDIHTGEVIDKKKFKKQYVKIKTNKHVKFNRTKSIGRRCIEIGGEKKPQIRITFGDE